MRALVSVLALMFIVWLFVTIAQPFLERIAEALR